MMFMFQCPATVALMVIGRALMSHLLTHSLHLTYPLAGQRGCADVEESGLDVAGDGLANERFARPWGTKEEQALGGRSCALWAYRQCMGGSKRCVGGQLPACAPEAVACSRIDAVWAAQRQIPGPYHCNARSTSPNSAPGSALHTERTYGWPTECEQAQITACARDNLPMLHACVQQATAVGTCSGREARQRPEHLDQQKGRKAEPEVCRFLAPRWQPGHAL